MDVSIIKKWLQRKTLALSLLLAIQPAHAAFVHDQTFEWQTLESAHFNIHFHNGAKTIALNTVKISESFLEELQSQFNWIPEDKIDIIISDEADYSNGFVMPFLPGSRMTLLVNPPDNVSEYQDWFRNLIRHELSHALHLDKANGTPSTLRNIFGNHPLLFPAVFQHRWLTEGLATYIESTAEPFIGRGQSSQYAMMMRSEVKHGIKPLEQINSRLSSWPLGQAPYLYGYYFFEFLEAQYGRESIVKLIDIYSDNLIPFNLNEAFIKTYNLDIEELWQVFQIYLHKKFDPQLSDINQQGIVEGAPLTQSGYVKMYAEPINNEQVLIGQYNGENEPSLVLQNVYDGKSEYLTELETDSRLDYHNTKGILISKEEYYRNTNFFYDVYVLKPDSIAPERLTRGQRLRRAVWSPDGKQFLAVYSKLGRHSLALMQDDGKVIDVLWEAKEGELIGDLDWSPDGEHLIASIKNNNTSWNLQEYSLQNREWQSLGDHQALETQPQYSPDGNFIFYSADYDGIFNIYRLNRESKEIAKITNVEGGAFYPKLSPSGNLIYLNYNAAGFDVFRIEQPVLLKTIDQATLQPALQQEYVYKDYGFSIKPYNPVKQFAPRWWEPRFYFSENTQSIGAYTTGSDALYRHNYDAFTEWDFDTQQASLEFNYSYDRWFALLQTRIKSTKRKYYIHEDILFEALAPLLSREDRWYASASFSYEDDTTKKYDEQDNITEIDSRNRLFGFGLIWDSREKHARAHSYSDGRLVTSSYETSAFTNSTNKGQMLMLDWREYRNLNALNVVGLRVTGGLGIETPRPFQLGGTEPEAPIFQNNIYSPVQYRTNFYNKRRFPLRGYSQQTEELSGRRMLMLNAEWRFPISRTERGFSVFPLALNQLSGSLFYNSASVWDSGLNPETFYHAIGAEISADTDWFVYIPATWRLGVATGLSRIGENQLYLTIGSSF